MKKFILPLLVVLTMVLPSCGGDSDSVIVEPITPELTLIGAPSTHFAKPIPSLLRFRVKANQAWAITLSEGAHQWITLTQTEGIGSDEEQAVTASFARNIDVEESRTAVVTVTLKDSTDKKLSFTVVQKSEYLFVQDSIVLVEIRESLKGDNWYKPWDLSKPMSTWVGVWINEQQDVRRVTDIWLDGGNNMDGDFPFAITKLSALSSIRFRNEPKMRGTLPVELGNLKDLQKIFLENCAIGGVIPASLSNCPLLDAIAIDSCLFTGIENGVGDIPKLIGFTVKDCRLSGDLSQQTWYRNMTKLVLLDISNNDLTGAVPNNLINGKGDLIVLHLSGNRFEGAFPEALSAKRALMNDSESSLYICPQQAGFGFTTGTCPESN